MATKDIDDDVISHAIADARGFCEEFPGEYIDGDWDSDAFGECCNALGLVGDDRDNAWPLYASTLHSAVVASVGRH